MRHRVRRTSSDVRGLTFCTVNSAHDVNDSSELKQTHTHTTFIYFSPVLCFTLVYNCGLTVRNKQIGYVMLDVMCYVPSVINRYVMSCYVRSSLNYSSQQRNCN